MSLKKSVIAPAALIALKDALAKIYWYKHDLEDFLTHAVSDQRLVKSQNWSDVKRNIVHKLVDSLSENQEKYQDDLMDLMAEVVRMKDFSHLESLEDGEKKAKAAKTAVDNLRTLYESHDKIIREREKSKEQWAIDKAKLSKNLGLKSHLASLKTDVMTMVAMSDARARGYKLEQLLQSLFILFDLNPKAPFKITGEQIDGAFTLDNTEFLLEAKWYTKPTERKDLDAFHAKIEHKLENTLGLFFSFNGFVPSAVAIHSGKRPKMILMDGQDLMAVLEERIDLIQLLLRKRRHAATTGDVFLKFQDF